MRFPAVYARSRTFQTWLIGLIKLKDVEWYICLALSESAAIKFTQRRNQPRKSFLGTSFLGTSSLGTSASGDSWTITPSSSSPLAPGAAGQVLEQSRVLSDTHFIFIMVVSVLACSVLVHKSTHGGSFKAFLGQFLAASLPLRLTPLTRAATLPPLRAWSGHSQGGSAGPGAPLPAPQSQGAGLRVPGW